MNLQNTCNVVWNRALNFKLLFRLKVINNISDEQLEEMYTGFQDDKLYDFNTDFNTDHYALNNKPRDLFTTYADIFTTEVPLFDDKTYNYERGNLLNNYPHDLNSPYSETLNTEQGPLGAKRYYTTDDPVMLNTDKYQTDERELQLGNKNSVLVTGFKPHGFETDDQWKYVTDEYLQTLYTEHYENDYDI